MSSVDMRQEVERLSEALVLAEPQDLPAMADLHTMFQRMEEWARGAALDSVASAMTATADLLERIILDEVAQPADALRVVNGAASALQMLICEGRDPAEIAFPPELTEAVAVSGGAPVGGGPPPLPAHIDESIFSDFLARQPGVLDDFERLVLTLESEPAESTLQELKRLIHTLKGEAGMLGLEDVERLCHRTEDALGERPFNELSDILLEVHDWLGRTFSSYSGRGDAPASVAGLVSRLEGGVAAESAPAAPPSAPEPEPEPEEEIAEPQMLEGDPELLGEFVAEANEHLDNADLHLLTLETDPKNDEALNAVFRAFHTIKGVSGFLALPAVQSLAHEAENLLDRARKGELTLEGGYIDLTFDSVDMLKRLIARVAEALSSGSPLQGVDGLGALLRRLKDTLSGKVPESGPRVAEVDPDQRLGELLVERHVTSEAAVEAAAYQQQVEPEPELLGEILVEDNIISRVQLDHALAEQRAAGGTRKLGEVLLDMGMVTKEDLGAVLERQESGPRPQRLGELLVRAGEAAPKDVAQTLRAQKRQQLVEVKENVKVDAERLDRLIDLIGEMVIAESMVSQSQELIRVASSDVQRQLGQLDKITRELQEMGTSLRMIPVRATFQKMARLARDVAKKAGKRVDFVMAGEDTELDKSVVDKIGDPLVHMVRNAVDHGIEGAEEDRVKAGKPPVGRVELKAYHKGGSIFIEINDDGRGLDREAIFAKGRERGLIKDGETLSDSDVFKLIFEPGFSTAKKVTDVSGRGVGMDVVRRNIEALRGQVEIQSEMGRGSTFRIRLPLTLAIIDGMVIRVGTERYIIPTLSVVRSIQPAADDIFTVVKRGEMLSIQGQLIPMFRLHRMFRISGAEEDPTQALVVIVEDGGRHAGLLIDELLGQQQIVIKSLGEAMQGLMGISGGAIMSDGLVGLILDVGGLVKLANTEPGRVPAVV